MPEHFHHPIVRYVQHLPGGGIVTCLSAGSGALSLEKLIALRDALISISPEQPVVLMSDALALPPLATSEQLAWIQAAGEYRRLQEDWKQQGGLLISLVTQTLHGGTYLLHGMAARYRLVYPTTRIYPALPPPIYQAITQHPYPHAAEPQQALQTGVITHVVQPPDLWETMATWVSHR